ncbi:MAG: GlxA family transcriptional regulator [Arenicellales bacterium]
MRCLSALELISTPLAQNSWLKNSNLLSNEGSRSAGICTASYQLARAGILDGYRCTLHWENIPDMHDEFPHLVVSSGLFELDRDRYTCSGGTAPIDMMLTLIARERGRALSDRISEGMLCERIRDGSDRQRMPLRMRLGSSQPKLVEAVELMESNIEEPMTLDELATHVGISRRQLERLFQKHLQCVPTRYYLEIRLRRARSLLLRSSRSIVDIAFACGFVSAPHFSKCYRDFFGIPPREERLPKVNPSALAPMDLGLESGNNGSHSDLEETGQEHVGLSS